jgi:hypothetical protein
MAHYLVTARPNADRLSKLRSELARDAFIDLNPSATHSASRSRTHACSRMGGLLGRRRTIAALRWRRSAPPFSTITLGS